MTHVPHDTHASGHTCLRTSGLFIIKVSPSMKAPPSTMEIKKNVSLKDKNWFNTGGTATFFCEPKTKKDLAEALTWAQKLNVKVEVLGEGANLLVSDEGFDGLIICPKLKNIFCKQESVTVEAGTSIQECIDWSLQNNLVGLEVFSGIPGTIGGAAYINIHYFDAFFSQFIEKATIINKSGEIKTVTSDWFAFGYDTSTLQKKEWILVDATIQLKSATDIETAYSKGRRDEIIRHRNSRYPTEKTCGSFFRNFTQEELLNSDNKLPFIAYYLDKLGCKGALSCGGAIVSPRHANMLLNKDNATSQDIINLAKKMQELVFKNFHILPQPECQFLGFKDYPLHTKETIFRSHHVKSSGDNQPSVEP